MIFANVTLLIMRATERKAVFRNFFSNDMNTPVDGQITSVLDEMSKIGVSSSDYPTFLEYLERLNEIKTKVRQLPVSRDTIALIAANLIGIILIVAYEQKHVIASKGFNQIIRPKS